MAGVERCRSCGASVEWRLTPAGKPCPYDAGTDISHFKTCNDPARWSKKAPPAKPPKRAPLRTWEDEGLEDVDPNALPFGGRFGPPQSRDPIPGQPPLLPVPEEPR